MQDIEHVFRKAFERHADELFRHAALRLSDRERAVELTQECFLRAWRYAGGGKEVRDIRAFLFRTLRNLVIDEYRKKKPLSLDAMTEDDEGVSMESKALADDTDEMEAALDRFDGARAVSLLRELPDLYHEVLTLRYVDELSIREIATITGESENVISVRLHRGLKKLRTLLESE